MSIFLGAAEDVPRIRAALETLVKSVQSERATASWSERDAMTFKGVVATLRFPAAIQAKRSLAPNFTGCFEALGRTIEIGLEIKVDKIKDGANGVGVVGFSLLEQAEPFYRFRIGATGEIWEDAEKPAWSGHVSSEQEAQRVFMRALAALAARLTL